MKAAIPTWGRDLALSKDVLKRHGKKGLFEPFFTTKPGEQGLGLGLTLSASLATSADKGAVRDKSKLGG